MYLQLQADNKTVYFKSPQSPLHGVVMSPQFEATPTLPLQKYLNDEAAGKNKRKDAPLPPNIVRDIANKRSDIGQSLSHLCEFINAHLTQKSCAKIKIRSMADKVKLLLQLKAHVQSVEPHERLCMVFSLVDKEEPTYDLIYGGEIAVFSAFARRPPLHAVTLTGSFQMTFTELR